MYNSFAIVLHHVIYFIFGSSLWARPRVPNTKYHLKMAVGVSWSSAGLATGNQTQSPVGLIGLVHKTKQEGLHPLGRALAGLGVWDRPHGRAGHGNASKHARTQDASSAVTLVPSSQFIHSEPYDGCVYLCKNV
jgi:hypothetical protein